MNDLDYLFNLLEKSSIAVIGYSSDTEHIKETILSKLSVYKIGRINADNFNSKQILRDAKLCSLFGEINTTRYYHLDVSEIITSKDSPFSLSIMTSKIIQDIRSEIWNMYNKYSINEESELGLDFDDCEDHKQFEMIPPFRLIVTTPTYKSLDSTKQYSIRGGDRIVYSADLFMLIKDKTLKDKLFNKDVSLKIIKNRFNYDDDNDINLKDLNNYNYICNYEYSK
jgi:hypothetical protein